MAQASHNEIGKNGVKSASDHQFLTFMLAGNEYGVDILSVQEIRGWEQVRPLPDAPDFVCGVMNLRGEVMLVVDLRKRFGLEAQAYSATTVVIIVHVTDGDAERGMGLVVDAVSEVYAIQPKNMRPPPRLGNGVRSEMLKGVAMVEKEMVFVLDLQKLVSHEVLDTIPDEDSAVDG